MPQLPWFRMYHEARTDAKLRTLADDEFRVWFNLLCYAAEQEETRGSMPAIDSFLLSVQVSGGDEELLNRTLAKLERLSVIEWDENSTAFTFIHFEDRQYDKPSDHPERVAERVKRHRAKNETPDSGDETPPIKEVTPRKRDVTPSNALDRDRDKEGDRDKELEREGERKPPPDKPARSSGTPFEALMELCEATGADVSELSETTKSKQLGKAKQLIGQGKSVEDIGRCAGYLASETWRTSAVDLFTVEKDWGKWELAGKPLTAKSRASPNGQPLSPQQRKHQRLLEIANGESL